MASKGKLYVVTMYRYGERENHSYVLGVWTKKHRAVQGGEAETEWRGGKYYPEVLETDANPDHDVLRGNGRMEHLKTILELPSTHPLSGLPMGEHAIRKIQRTLPSGGTGDSDD